MCAAAALLAAAAAWVSFGTIGIDSIGSRIGLLPVDVRHIAVAVAAGLLILLLSRGSRYRRDVVVAVLPLVLTLLPWVPIGLPAALMIWVGPVTTAIWLAVALALIVPRVRGRWQASARTQALAAGALCFVAFSLSAKLVSPTIPGGDEPHYLVITQSLLYDHDLRIENNHRRGDYRAYFLGELNPDWIRRGRNGAIYSIHAPGVPALVLPAFAIAGYHGVVVFLLLLSSAACALTWWLAWRVTGSASAAWFGWAAVALSPPYLLETFTVYPDGPGAAIVIVGFWGLLRADWEREQGKASPLPWLFYGTALAALPWMHTRFAVLAATLGGLILLRLARGPNPAAKAIAFLVVPAVSALSWLGFFLAIYGTPDPSAPYAGQLQSSFSFLLNGAGGLFFDQGFGLILTAPVLIVAFAGFRRTPRLALEWTIVAVPYLLAVTTFAMWWAGWSGPARFFVPLILPLAIPAAAAWQSAQDRAVRTSLAAALAVTCWLSAVLVGGGGGRLAYHTRNEGGMTAAPWLEWAIPSLDVPAALPAFVPLPNGTALVARETAARNGFLLLIPWVVCLGGATFFLRSIVNRLPPGRAPLGAAATIVYALAVSVALAAIWRGHGLTAVNAVAAQTNLLRRIAHERVLAIDLSDRRRLSRDDVVMRVRIDLPNRRIERGGRPNQPIAAIAQVPAGEYLIETERLGGDGWVMAGVGLDQFALVTQPAATFDAGVRLRLPVDVRTLVVRADDEARQLIVRVRMRPLHVAAGSERLTRDVAYHAVRYGTTSVFFLDDRAFPEPSAFWVGGGRETAVVISPDHASPSLPLLLRNAPIANVVTLSSAGWHEELTLDPGEERRVDVPVQGDAALVRLRSKAGFRPSDADPRNRDTRDLGVYVRVPGP